MNPIPHSIQGAALIGATERHGGPSFEAHNPATGERLTPSFQRQLLAIMCAILLIVVVLSDWTGATV